jgi:cystathionine beta-synthase
MIERAEKLGELKPGGTVVEATSGNTGIGLALACAIRGYRSVFVMTDKCSQEKVRYLKALGADVIVVPAATKSDSPDHYVNLARRIAAETPNSILTNQYGNPANPEAHYRTTGPGDLGGDSRTGDPFCRRDGNRGNDQWNRAIPQGEESRDQDRWGGSLRVGL